MKNIYKSLSVLVIIMIIGSANVGAESTESIYMWKFNCGVIYAKPLIHDSIIYFSTDDKKLYAVNINKAEEIWHYDADKGNSFPAIKDSIIVFEASNKLYALHALTGKLFWKFSTDTNAVYSLGTTDYHHSSPVITDSLVIFCDQSGYINGIDLKTGKLIYQFLTDGHNPLRGTPAVKDSVVFAGDWIGNIYAVSLKDSVLIWKHVMQNIRDYYGAVVSEMIIKDDVLYFGSQHDVFSPLDITNGEPVWTYVDPRATYLPPTPVFYEDKIIIGTTINANQIMCFKNDNVHQQIWNFQATGIFFTSPVIKDSILIMNSCNFDFKTGYMHLLNCKNGKQIRQLQFTNTGPYIPVMHDSILFIGTRDGLYAANFNAILEGKGSQITIESGVQTATLKRNSGRRSISVSISTVENICDSVTFSMEIEETLEKTGFNIPAKKIVGKLNSSVILYVYTDSLPAGTYHIAVSIQSQNQPDISLTKNIIVTIEETPSGIESVQSNGCPLIFPNPASETVIFRFNEMYRTNIRIKVFSITGELIATKTTVALDGNYEYLWNLQADNGMKIPKGEYICQIISDKDLHCKKLVVN